ncbi:hypothetical protein B0H14DRAFT_3503937 [Mycena olivaceomarginata]|nr:hypothetical protein B0H14DRAFT_3503937 [Mycena olivaceomarginata]
MVKLDVSSSNPNALRLLDTAAFEKKNLKECDMDHAQWPEAAKNMITFVGEMEGEGSEAQRRWDAYSRAERNFPAILTADIELQYDVQPFTFEESIYSHSQDDLVGHLGYLTAKRVSEYE